MKRRELITKWKLSARIEHVAEAIVAFERLPEWWGSVFLDAKLLERGDGDGMGRRARFLTRSRLPFTFLWEAEIAELTSPHNCHIRASGDIEGDVTWHLHQNGAIADVEVRSDIVIKRPLLGMIAPVIWPTIVDGHRWAMEKGLAGLTGELEYLRSRPV